MKREKKLEMIKNLSGDIKPTSDLTEEEKKIVYFLLFGGLQETTPDT